MKTRGSITFAHTTIEEVEKRLLDGQSPRDVGDALDEPLANIIGVWSILRDEGKVQARNFPAQQASTPSQTRIAGNIVERGLTHSSGKVKRLAERAQTALAALGAELAKHDQQAKARAEVDRLEAELSAARERLRTGQPATIAEPQEATRAPRRVNQAVTCDVCGAAAKSPAGLSAHKRFNHAGSAA